MDIFEDCVKRLPRRQPLNLSQQCGECRFLALYRTELLDPPTVSCRQPEQVGQDRHMFRVRGGLRNESVQLGEFLGGRVAAFETCRVLEVSNDWKKRGVGMVRRAEIAQCDVRFTVQPLIKCARNVRLADTRLPGQQHNPALSQSGKSPPAQQQLYLLFASVQRRRL